ncbi:MAG TPA: flagellar hook-basal body complex protein [Solirubrobacterales bacterium]|nr:flagellar hook-basal body complex protein [Solirubrobacterales bacterium]
MDRGLYIAASGMLAEMVRQEQIANDLANSTTPGYKADRSAQAGFGQLLLGNTANGRPIGRAGLGVQIDEVRTDLTPAAIHETGEPLDFAVEGEGFFAVRTAAGTRYTRNGQFGASAAGTLVDAFGNEVLGGGGAPVRLRRDGTVRPGDIGVFAVADARKQGDSLFAGAASGAASGRVRSGALEESATDPAHSMVEMIASFRSLEAGQKALQTIDETLGESAGQVGAVS